MDEAQVIQQVWEPLYPLSTKQSTMRQVKIVPYRPDSSGATGPKLSEQELLNFHQADSLSPSGAARPLSTSAT